MTTRTVILRSVQHYWRTHLGVILGAALGALVLTGALLVGDSVKATLRRQAELRVGKADVAMTGGDRFFRAALAEAAGEEAAPVLMLRATVARADGGARVNAAQLLGVDARFWKLSPSDAAANDPGRVGVPPGASERDAPPRSRLEVSGGTPTQPGNDPAPSPDTVDLNTRLAAQLGVTAGDTVIVRVEKPGAFSKDAPLSGEENEVVALRVKVARVVGDADYGRFALAASQVPPFTVFAPLAVVQEKISLPTKANLLLVPGKGKLLQAAKRLSAEALNDAAQYREGSGLRQRHEFAARSFGNSALVITGGRGWEFEDLQLELLDLPNNSGLELRTPRVFLDPPVVAAAPRGKDDRRVDSLTYFVNELRAGDKATPYSMVTAVEAPSSGFLPAELADDEIVISQWEADDLGIGTGAKVTVKYFVMGERRQLEEKAREFTVLAVLPMNEPQLNTSWMPDFPGLSDKKNCRDWKPGFEFDATRMRDKDQAYWEQYRGTPKAFVNLKVGQEMWGNRWGNTTALRWPAGTDRAEIEAALREKLTPEMLGFQFIPLREQALAATKAPVDFGQLFVSFSFFLIVAAAVLTGLLFVFSLEQRNAEAGLLLALGLRPRQVRRMFLLEGAALAVIGSVLGVVGAALYTKLVLHALATVWRGAVGAVEFEFTMPPATLAIGAVTGVIVALLSMWLASRRQMRRTARELLVGTGTDDRFVTRRHRIGRLLLFLPALGMLISAYAGWISPTAFFVNGALLLVAAIACCGDWLLGMTLPPGRCDMTNLSQLGVRNAARRRGRSLATIAVLASGVFMVVAVDSFRHGPKAETAQRDSGTGGFALVGESALPIYEDLNTAKGREAYGLDEPMMSGVSVVPMRVRDGDDASCLNLNRAMQPRVLGVDQRELEGRFRFSRRESGWGTLEKHPTSDEETAGAVPGIVDANTLQWALQKKVGEVLEYRDERGQPANVRVAATVAGSMLQGNVIIAEDEFVRRFPGSGGYRFFLIDCPTEKMSAVREHLSRQLADRGLELTTTAQRLAEFQAVENTYLAIFQVLGGLGLLLGSAGLAIVVARNVLERRSEFGLLEAVGFRPAQLRRLVFAEHRLLIVCGLAIGTVCALVAVWPNLRERASGFPYGSMGLLLAGMVIGCFFWAWLATWLALRGRGSEALRAE